jgi:hypothetical protein
VDIDTGQRVKEGAECYPGKWEAGEDGALKVISEIRNTSE